jgi:hypothetical protein
MASKDSSFVGERGRNGVRIRHRLLDSALLRL